MSKKLVIIGSLLSALLLVGYAIYIVFTEKSEAKEPEQKTEVEQPKPIAP